MDKRDNEKQPSEESRRPYQPPKVEESASFEHLVLLCTHISTGLCRGGAKS